jgi:hypothetical protein
MIAAQGEPAAQQAVRPAAVAHDEEETNSEIMNMTDAIRDVKIDRRALILCSGGGLAIMLATTLPLSCAAAAAAAGAVDDLRGAANAELDGKKRDLKLKESVFFGDAVSTADRSLLTLKLGPSTTLKLGPQAQIRIDRYLAEAGGVFDMVSGPMMFERTGPKSKGDIQFRNAYGLMAVRGTRFYAGATRGRFSVLVGTGRVDVSAGGRTVSLGPRQGTDFANVGAPPTPARSWPDARVAEMLAYFK